ncbi:TIGR00730 family Rossman fold protein (plasmid) [Verrucomicrobiaceae bacterium 227]
MRLKSSRPGEAQPCPEEPQIDKSVGVRSTPDHLVRDRELSLLAGPHERLQNLITIGKIGADFLRGFRALHFVGPCVTVFGSARLGENSPYYKSTREVGAMIARLGFTVMTGGGPGLMEAANRGAKEAGGRSIGCNIRLPREQQPNPYLDRQVTLNHFFVRKVLLIKYSYAFIVMPGGAGTMDELFEALTLIQTGKLKNFPIIVMGTEFWKPIHALVDSMLKAGTISESDLDLITVTDNIEEAEQRLREHSIQEFGLLRVSERSPKPHWIFGERGLKKDL